MSKVYQDICLSFIILANLYDAWSTHVLISSGTYAEKNPLAKAFMREGNLDGFLLVKFTIIVSILIMLIKAKELPPVMLGILYGTTSLYFGLTLHTIERWLNIL
jgi:uncharacterized membrane protein